MVAAIRNAVLRGYVREERAQEAFADYLSLRLVRRAHQQVLGRVFELRANLVPYDAAYVALAESLEATFVTCDLRLTRAARQFTDLNVVGVGA